MKKSLFARYPSLRSLTLLALFVGLGAAVSSARPRSAEVSLPWDLPEAEAVEGERLDAPPQLTKRGKDRHYPEHLTYNGSNLRGVVVVRIRLEADGRLSEIRVKFASHPAFVPAAIASIRECTFRPASAQGRPVAAWADIAHSFDVRGSRGERVGVEANRVPAKIPGLPAEFDYDHPPVLKAFSEPVYPRALLQAGTKGEAAVRIVLDETGRVMAGEVLQTSDPAFGDALLAAAESWEFEPAQRKGAPSKAVVDHLHRFLPMKFRRPAAESKLLQILKEGRMISAEEQLERPLQALYQPAPVPPTALRGRTGEATVEFFVHESGEVSLSACIAATHPGFGPAAVNAIQQWVFAPPMRNGKPTAVRVTRVMKFGS